MTDTQFLKEVGAKIKEARKAKKMRVMDFQDLGITTATNFCRIQKGSRSPRLITLKRIADALKMDVKEFL